MRKPKVSLFVPCYVEQFYPQVAIASVQLLEKAGCSVDYPPGQTCCGQPAYNAGYWEEARRVARHFLNVFRSSHHIVAPSGSCVAMVREYYPILFQGDPLSKTAAQVGQRCFELCEFIVKRLGMTDFGAKFQAKATYHDGCHAMRELGLRDEPRQLLRSVKGLDLVEAEFPEVCCGFGGMFAVKHHRLSAAMADEKLRFLLATGADYVVSTECSCMMHLEGRARKRGLNVRFLHVAELIAKGCDLL